MLNKQTNIKLYSYCDSKNNVINVNNIKSENAFLVINENIKNQSTEVTFDSTLKRSLPHKTTIYYLGNLLKNRHIEILDHFIIHHFWGKHKYIKSYQLLCQNKFLEAFHSAFVTNRVIYRSLFVRCTALFITKNNQLSQLPSDCLKCLNIYAFYIYKFARAFLDFLYGGNYEDKPEDYIVAQHRYQIESS